MPPVINSLGVDTQAYTNTITDFLHKDNFKNSGVCVAFVVAHLV